MSFVPRQELNDRFELRRVHHRAEGLWHDARELFIALGYRRGGIQDLLPDRFGIAPRADVRDVGRDDLALPLELVAGEAARGLDDRRGVRRAAGGGGATRRARSPGS